MTHPLLAHRRSFGAAALALAVSASPLPAQERIVVEPAADAVVPETESDPVRVSTVPDDVFDPSLGPTEQGSLPLLDPATAENAEDAPLGEDHEFPPLDATAILADAEAVANYRDTFARAENAAWVIQEAQYNFNALRALTPEESETAFPDGGYDKALNDASDALYWAIEDGRVAAMDLDEARFRLTKGRIGEHQVNELRGILGL